MSVRKRTQLAAQVAGDFRKEFDRFLGRIFSAKNSTAKKMPAECYCTLLAWFISGVVMT
jgi:hypothetical protein